MVEAVISQAPEGSSEQPNRRLIFERTEASKGMISTMDRNAQLKRKATLVLIHPASSDINVEDGIPLLTQQRLSVEDVSHLITPENFELWRENLSEKQREDLSKAKIALVHRFDSSGHVGAEEEASKGLAERAAACLRLIRPTRSRNQTIQLTFLDNMTVDVFRFTHPQEFPPSIPFFEVLNAIRSEDLLTLQRVLPRFLSLWEVGPQFVIWAVRYFISGHMEVNDPIAQLMMWVAGIEAVISEGSPISQADVQSRLRHHLGASWNIYEDTALAEWFHTSIELGEVLGDVFRLRNSFVHGGWVPEEWVGRVGRPAPSGSVEYADMLREAGAAILRKLVMNWLLSGAIKSR